MAAAVPTLNLQQDEVSGDWAEYDPSQWPAVVWQPLMYVLSSAPQPLSDGDEPWVYNSDEAYARIEADLRGALQLAPDLLRRPLLSWAFARRGASCWLQRWWHEQTVLRWNTDTLTALLRTLLRCEAVSALVAPGWPLRIAMEHESVVTLHEVQNVRLWATLSTPDGRVPVTAELDEDDVHWHTQEGPPVPLGSAQSLLQGLVLRRWRVAEFQRQSGALLRRVGNADVVGAIVHQATGLDRQEYARTARRLRVIATAAAGPSGAPAAAAAPAGHRRRVAEEDLTGASKHRRRAD